VLREFRDCRQLHAHDNLILLHRPMTPRSTCSEKPSFAGFPMECCNRPAPTVGSKEKNNVRPNAPAAIALVVKRSGRNVRPCRVKRCSLAAEQMVTGALFVLLQQVIQEQRPDSGHQIDKEEGGVPDLRGQRGGARSVMRLMA